VSKAKGRLADSTDARRCFVCGKNFNWVVLYRDGDEITVRVCLVCGYEEEMEE